MRADDGWGGLRRVFRLPRSPFRARAEVDAELRFHLEERAADLMAREGLARPEAEREARRRFGDVAGYRRQLRAIDDLTHRRRARMETLATIGRELRQAVRTLGRAPAFTAAAVATLALGIGASTAVVSVVDGVLLRGLPYRDPAQLAWITERHVEGGERLPSYPTFRDWQAQAAAGVAGMAFVRGETALLRGEAGPEALLSGYVTPGFFSLLGTRPLLGRTFRPDEERGGAGRVVVLSYPLWRERFGGDPAIVGQTIDVDSVPTTVIGVMPRGFAYPSWATVWAPIETIAATDSSLRRRGVHSDSRVVIRLRAPGDSARAAAVFGAVQARLAAAYPEDAAKWTGVALTPLRSELLGDVRPTLTILAAAAALVLLLACANVATLSLIRASVRARELAVRSALGAGRGRIARQLFAESTVVALAGGALGVLLAAGIVRYVRAAAAASLPRVDEIAVDGRVLALALIVALVAALLVGAALARRAARPVLAAQLRGGQRGATGGRSDAQLRGALVALQFAVTVVLLVASALLVQSFRRLQDVPLGFAPENLVAMRIEPPGRKYGRPDQALALYDRLRDAALLVPGVRSAAVVNHIPLSGASVPSRVDVQGRDADPRRPTLVLYRTASAEYLGTVGMRVTRGRWFAAADMRSPETAGFVVNETMARQLWPGGGDPVGQVITLRRSSQARADFGQPISGAVIGVVADVRQFGKDVDVAPEAFVPYTREVWPWITLVVRADDPGRAIPALRKAVLAVDADLPVGGRSVVAVSTLLTDTLARRRLALSLLGAFGAGALLLAAVGLYGAIAYSVTQRTRELGIRLALGATRASVLGLVLRGGLRLALLGAAVGLVGAVAAARGIRALLFATAPTDPASYVAGAALLAVVALAASYGPARRAVRLEPTAAMRDE